MPSLWAFFRLLACFMAHLAVYRPLAACKARNLRAEPSPRLWAVVPLCCCPMMVRLLLLLVEVRGAAALL